MYFRVNRVFKGILCIFSVLKGSIMYRTVQVPGQEWWLRVDGH